MKRVVNTVDEKVLLDAIGKMMDEKLNQKLTPICEQLDKLQNKVDRLQEDIAELKEDHAITREGVNTLLGWADDVACVVKIPLKPVN